MKKRVLITAGVTFFVALCAVGVGYVAASLFSDVLLFIVWISLVAAVLVSTVSTWRAS